MTSEILIIYYKATDIKTNTNMKLARVLKELREQAGLDQDEIARKIGKSQGYYSQIDSGKNIPTQTSILKKLALILNVEYEYLRKLAEKDELERGKQDIIERAKSLGLEIGEQKGPKFPYRIPILNDIPADIPSDFTDYDFPPGVAEDYVDNYLKDFTTTDPSTYALRVGGDCMEPELKKGDIVLLSATKEWKSGDIVAVKWNDGEKKDLRKIIKQDDHIILQPENPKYTPIVLNSKHAPQIMGVVRMVIRIKR